ncbi:hypothetical protein NpPPO83_00011678 [Neofusicoccum parvum]|uniref:Uncharacterized protein n=1 Tax=Neofusicoccum parvum TaxID=310453 RepID=A0ACB5SHR1_9PEZI|nr:hypothetical protein NpPPO83_00011678 [Neofusicoccum parvum]
MGGSDDTKKLITSASHSTVDLLINWAMAAGGIATEANGKKMDDGPTEKFEKLSETLDTTTRNQFLESYNYAYNDSLTNPPDIDPQHTTIYPFSEFVSCKDDEPTSINKYINNTIVPSMPTEWRKSISNDMVSTFTALLSESGNGFKLMPYHRQWKGPSADLLQVDAIIEYSQSRVTDDPNGQLYLFLRYCGVAYFIPNPIPPRLGGINPRNVTRIVLTASSAVVATALSSYILRLDPNKTNLYFLTHVEQDKDKKNFKMICTITPSSKSFTIPKQSRASMVIDVKPILDALKKIGINDPAVIPGVATTEEEEEFAYISRWSDKNF